MKINIKNSLDLKQKVLVLGMFEDDKNIYKNYNRLLHDELEEAIKNKIFELKFGKTYLTKISDSAYKRILVVCLGKKSELTRNNIRVLMSIIINTLYSLKLDSFTTNIISMINDLNSFEPKEIGMSVAEGLILSQYRFDKYKTNNNNKNKNKNNKENDKEIKFDWSASIQFNTKSSKYKEFNKGLLEGRIIAEATNLSRDLVNEPSNVVTPEYIEKFVKQLFRRNPKIKISVMNKEEMIKKGLNALIGVSKGSDLDPKLIFIQYNGASYGGSKVKKNKISAAIVGKGITFDSGGYDIKPAGKFADMKCDMSGAAAVIGTIKAMSELGIRKNILGVIPCCENMVSGSAQKPGDIVKAYNGKTIEIGNTDAEGRLILADAISYTEKNYSPEIIIDLATLTGACVVALGFYYSALFSNDKELADSIIKAGNDSNDRVWLMPFDEDYQDLMDGDITDLKNISRWDAHKAAGTITGAVFIGKFVEKAKWAHLDIAGTAFIPEEKHYNKKYATGAGVRLLTYYFMN